MQAPTAAELLNEAIVQRALEQAWLDSLSADPLQRHEEGGWTILECLTLDPETLPIPVLICSAAIHSLRDHESLLHQYDCEVVTKPFDLDTLLGTIRDTLARYPRQRRSS